MDRDSSPLAPFEPYFIVAAVTCLEAGYWLVYRSRIACADREVCSAPLGDRFINGVLIVATSLIVLAVGFNFLAPQLSS